MSALDSAWYLITNYWWVPVALMVLLVWSKYLGEESLKIAGKKLSRNDMKHFLTIVGSWLIVYLCVRYRFGGVKSFFYLALMVFTPLGAIVWSFAARRRDVYILENTIQGELMYDLGHLKKFAVPSTGVRLMKLPDYIYTQKEHQGSLEPHFWKKGTLVYCDYYDGKTLYHPEHPDLHNMTFYQAMGFWLRLKDTVPKVEWDLIEHGWGRDWWLADRFKQLEDKSWLALTDIRGMAPIDFKVPLRREDVYKVLRQERLQDLSHGEFSGGSSPKTSTKPEPSLEDLERLKNG